MHLPGNSRLSVIIPTLNEAENLPALLEDLKQQENINLEIIVGDGGSTDATRLIAESCGTTFVSSKRGRGAQMNAAALKASGKYYLFMHADSRVDDVNLFSNALQALSAAQLEQSLIAGHFRLRFIRGTSRNAFAYRYAEEKTAFNRVNTTNGDQGLLISREFFELLSGFDESMPFLEVRWPKKSDLRANGLHFRDSSKLRRVDLRPKDSIGVIP
jgi:glycosyltransferase involved in cell wall biosynthesis